MSSGGQGLFREFWSAAQGIHLGAWVGLGSLLMLVTLRFLNLNLAVQKEATMKHNHNVLAALAIPSLETIWAIGASSVANALPT
jgi:hypothetical protein